jgi:hypothetical protein
MGAHIVNGEFQSDKYVWCKSGFVPLKISDPMAQPQLWAYAQTRRSVDAEFSDDLEWALKDKGFASLPADPPTFASPSALYKLVDRALYLIDPMAISHMTLGTEWRVDAGEWIRDALPILFSKRAETKVDAETKIDAAVKQKEGAMRELNENSSAEEWKAWVHDHVDMYARTVVVPARVLLALVAARDARAGVRDPRGMGR